MKYKLHILALCLVIVSFNTAYAQENEDNPDSLKLRIDIPILDLPFNFSDGFYLPSMRQSLALSKSYYQVTYPLIERGRDKVVPPKLLNKVTRIAFILPYVLVSSYLPFGKAWVHEEYHRAVMKNKGIDSYNEVYELQFFSGGIAVSHIRDEDLVRLKRDYSGDMVRMTAAGYEAENDLILSLQKDAFFFGTSRASVVSILSLLNSYSYLSVSASNDANRITAIANREENTISERDASGFDFTAWVYDLFRPEEDYTARGVHPSGIGIDRYIKYSDLTPEERDFLKKQANLSLLNFLNPFLFGFKPIKLKTYPDGGTLLFTAGLMHYLTSFGHTVNVNLLFKKSNFNLFVSLLNQQNYKNYFPGFDVQLVDYPLMLRNRKFFITPRLSAWLQPEDQKFKTSNGQLGVLTSAKLAYPLNSYLKALLELEAKTAGWVAGNVFLDANFSSRVSLSMDLR